jgi:hypothetical protein
MKMDIHIEVGDGDGKLFAHFVMAVLRLFWKRRTAKQSEF